MTAAPADDPLPGPCPPKTRADLEWERLLGALAVRCVSARGRADAQGLPFLSGRAQIQAALDEVAEATQLEARGAPLPRAPLDDLAPTLDLAARGVVLSAEALCAVAAALAQARSLRRHLRSHATEAPRLVVSCDSDPALDGLGHELARCLDAEGAVLDQASAKLAELREELRTAKEYLVRRLEELVARHRELLSDGYWTERDGRYVLPVRADAHERFPGIVHATSGGGMTLFVEPRVVVPMGNRQKVLEAQVTREEEVVLAALSGLVRERASEVEVALEALARADLRAASAQLAADLQLHPPELLADDAPATVELVGARHPLLLLDGVAVVRSDLRVEGGHALVISGPNAGGKTVALKTIGLAVLMLRAGLPVAAEPGSRLTPFSVVLTDVGDDQSLARNLSTFSAHVKNLADILARGEKGALVLLDELAGATDPREGEALAGAVLEQLCDRGATVACTTHYEGLKTLALSDPRFLNASVGFDLASMTPTFRLALGVPGASSALAVARRFGVPEPVLSRAQALLGPHVASVSELVARLDGERQALERERDAAREEREALAADRVALAAERRREVERDRARTDREGDALAQGVRRAREELRAAQAGLRAAPSDPRVLREAEKKIAEVARQVSLGGPLEPRKEDDPPRPEVRAVTVGMKVFVPRLRTEAQVVEVLSGGQVRVAAGPLKLLTTIEELRSARPAPARASGEAAKREARSRRAAALFDAAADPDLPIQTSSNTVDLRGLRAHEAVDQAEQFLDRCLGQGLRVAFLIHGHGTGALRKEIREAVKSSPYVERSRPGEGGEGGDGVTVVWLR